VNQRRCRTWLSWVAGPAVSSVLLIVGVHLVSKLLRQPHDLISPSATVALNLVLHSLIRIALQRRRGGQAAELQLTPEQESAWELVNWEMVKGMSLALQILTAPVMVLGLLSGLGALRSGERWDPESWGGSLFCAFLFFGMWFWRTHARRDLEIRLAGTNDPSAMI
jgi:hypothetical protein